MLTETDIVKKGVVIAPDQRLRAKTKPVKKISDLHRQIVKGMVKLTKTFLDPEGVGLASTQIGNNEQYFVAKLPNGSFKSFFNPKILRYSKKTKVYFEGCLSIPDFYGEVRRSISVTVTYTNEQGKEVTERLNGIPAWIFQHEYDHLQGKLFMDLVLEQKSKLYKVAGKDRTGADVFEEVQL